MSNGNQRRRRRTGAEIEQVLARYHQSQLTQAQFVKQEGICLASLTRYLTKARANAAGTQSGNQDGFIEIECSGELGPTAFCASGGGTNRDSYRLCFEHGTELAIPRGFCTREVATLMELISSAKSR